MRDRDEDWPSSGHQREVFGFRNSDFTALVPTSAPQFIPIEQRQEIELARPAKPSVNLSLIRHELIHPGISEEDMFKDAVQERKRRVEEYEQEKEHKRATSARVNFSGPKELVGICIQMCPRWDRLRRANNKSAISTYEVDEAGYFGETRAVKSWHRPAAGEAEDLPEDLRTEETLMKTMDYLVHTIIDKWSFAGCQNFIWDRTRSIRQDCSIQGLNSDGVIECYERIARFHIFSIQQLSHNENFQRGQELEQLSKTLISLNELYDDRRRLIKQGKRQYNPDTDYEAEFRAYTLLSNIYNPLQIARALQLPSRITETPIFRLALQLFKYAQRANHDDKNLFGNTSRSEATLNWSAQFFDLLHNPSTPYLLACLAAMEFMNIKKGAIKTFERGFPPQKTASSLNLLKELVDAPSEEDVKLAVERYGLKTTQQQSGAWYMDTPRKSQPSTWIAQPPPVSPPFPVTVERKRGQAPNGQSIPARFFIDEPGCYRRVVSQLCEVEVDIRYNDPVEHVPTTDGPVHIMQFASSWESVGTIVHDSSDKVEADLAGNGLFDLIQNTRAGNVPTTQAENFVSYIGQRKKGGRKPIVAAPATSVNSRIARMRQQAAPSFQGFPKSQAPTSTSSTPPPQSQGQFKPPAAFPSTAFPSAFPSQQTAPAQTQLAPPSNTAASVPSAFGVKPAVTPVFGAPASAFGTRPPAAPAFGSRPGSGTVTPAFGSRVSTPPVSAFGQKVADAPALVSAFGAKPPTSDSPAALQAGSPAPSGASPLAAASPAHPVGSPADGPLFAPAAAAAAEKPPVASVFESKPPAPVSVFDQKPVAPTPALPTPPVSIFDQVQPLAGQTSSQGLFPGLSEKPLPQAGFPSAQPSLNPSAPTFAPAQNFGTKPPAPSIFDQQRPAPAPVPSVFNLEPAQKPVASFFPAPTSAPAPAPPAQESAPSVFGLEPARPPVTSFFPTVTPASKPPLPLFPSTTPQTEPASASIFDPAPPKPSEVPVGDTTVTKEENPFTLEEAPHTLQPEPGSPEPIEVEEPESPKPKLAPSGLPLEDTLPDSSHEPLPSRQLNYRDVIEDIAPEFFRKLDPSRQPAEPWYPGIDALNKAKYTDVRELAKYRDALKTAAWHNLTLAECNKDGLPALLAQNPPDTWQLQLVCADQSRKSLGWFMQKFEQLTERDGEETYHDIHVASSHVRNQAGRIGGVIFGCTAVAGKDGKELKRALKHDKGVLRRTVENALRAPPETKLHVLVLAYKATGRTRKAQEENARKALGVEELEEDGTVVVKVMVLETLEDLQRLHEAARSFGVGLVVKKKDEEKKETSPPVSASAVTKKRELEELEAQTAKLLLDADKTAMKRRRFGEDRGQAYIYGLPAFETPLKRKAASISPPQQQIQVQAPQQSSPKSSMEDASTTRKRTPIEDISGARKRKVKAVGESLSKTLSSVSAKFDAWALPGGDDEVLGVSGGFGDSIDDWEKSFY
ncbi:hypothetical protein Dda_1037 [Drechslerella dactyloides]|uniref:SAC3/GANP/THP3 conserved domain-containing protein n=1 Tax=Drechslerella dactyloides TaxID=74499 RepID=A0AAD6J5L2_DREDA|nr:hypothetical protein Dda_1037 [Drechslerella dactyloides]